MAAVAGPAAGAQITIQDGGCVPAFRVHASSELSQPYDRRATMGDVAFGGGLCRPAALNRISSYADRYRETCADHPQVSRFSRSWVAVAIVMRSKRIVDLLAASRLIGALYATMGDFDAFTAVSLLYFAAVSFAETAQRLGKPELAPGFLLREHPAFGPASRLLLERAHRLNDTRGFAEEVVRLIEPFNVGASEIPRVATGIPCARKTYCARGTSWAPAGRRLLPCWIRQGSSPTKVRTPQIPPLRRRTTSCEFDYQRRLLFADATRLC